MHSSAAIFCIDAKASFHVPWALTIEEHRGRFIQALNQQHLFYSVVDNQLSAY
jgi:hypothetical protein